MTKKLFKNWQFQKKLLFTMENATAAGSSQSNISRVYIFEKNQILNRQMLF